MKTWEIARDMYYGIYKEGTIFQNGDMGDMIIEDGELCYEDGCGIVTILLGDDSDWEVLSSSLYNEGDE